MASRSISNCKIRRDTSSSSVGIDSISVNPDSVVEVRRRVADAEASSETPADPQHAWPELEARLPDAISGRDLAKISLVAHPDRQDAKTLEVLRRLDKSVSDLQLANAELAGTDLKVGAMRITLPAFAAVAACILAAPADAAVHDLAGYAVVDDLETENSDLWLGIGSYALTKEGQHRGNQHCNTLHRLVPSGA